MLYFDYKSLADIQLNLLFVHYCFTLMQYSDSYYNKYTAYGESNNIKKNNT